MRGGAEGAGRVGARSATLAIVRTLLVVTVAMLAVPSFAGSRKKTVPAKATVPARAAASASAKKADPAAAQRAFDKLKLLEGKWSATHRGMTTEAIFDVVAGQTAVMQRTGFVTIYYLEDGALVGISFTDEGSQPRLRSATGLADGGDAIDFDIPVTTNQKPGKGEVTGLTIRFVDADHVVQTYRWREGGKDSSFEIAFARHSASTLK